MKSLKKFLVPVAIAAVLAPAWLIASHENTDIIGDPCLVRIYHTDFDIGEGEIVQKDGQLWYARTYDRHCEDAADGLRRVRVTDSRTPSRTVSNSRTADFFLGDLCFVRVYHEDFAFPSEGGVIVEIDDEWYFVPTYLPGCRNADDEGRVIRRASDQRIGNPSNTGPRRSAFADSIIGDPCIVPIYHTDFALNGGKIVERDGELYYVKSYLPECANI